MLKELFCKVETKHIGAVACGVSGVGMGLHEDTVGPHGDGSTTDSFNHIGTASGNTGRLVRLLERVGDINHHRHMVLLHGRHPTKVDHEVLITKGGAAFGKHKIVAAESTHLTGNLLHSLG